MPSQIESTYIEVNGLRAYLARPTGESGTAPTAGMLLLPMITGIGSQVREFADTIAARTETVALAWDPWHGKSSDDTEMRELHAMLGALEDDVAVAEQQILLRYLREELALTQVGVAGWCLGGRFALILGGLDAGLANVLAFHPTVPGEPAPTHSYDSVALAATIEAPTFLAYPGKDSIVPRENFLALQDALQSREHAPSIIHVYPQALHGFSDKRWHGEQVNATAFALSWPQALAFITATTPAA